MTTNLFCGTLMTNQEIYEKYGNIPLKHNYMDEFAFSFQTILPDGILIRALIGGDLEKHFRTNISRQVPITLKDRKHFYAFITQYNEEIWSESYLDYIDENDKLKEENERLLKLVKVVGDENLSEKEFKKNFVQIKDDIMHKFYAMGRDDEKAYLLNDITNFLVEGEFSEIAELINMRVKDDANI